MYMCAKNHNLNISGCWEIGKIWTQITVNFLFVIHGLLSVGQPAWQESSKVKSQSRDFRFIFDEKWRSTLRLKYVGLQ